MPTSVFHYSAVVVIILVISILFSAFKSMESRDKKAYLIISLGFLSFLTMFHGPEVGNDTAMYTNRFLMIAGTDDVVSFIRDSTMEPGYILYNYVISRITDNPQALFVVSGLLIYCSVGRVLYRYCEAPGLVVFCLVTMQFFDMYLSGIRQVLALAILLFSYSYILEKRPAPFVFLVLLATTFHYTAILFLIAYPVANVKFNQDSSHRVLRAFAIVLVVMGVFFAFDPLLQFALSLFPKYRYYIGSSVFVSEPNLAIFLRTAVYLLMLLVPRIMSGKTGFPNGVNADDMTRFSLCNILLSIVSMNASVLGRLCVYFSPFAIIQYANSVNELEKSSSVIVVILSLILLFIFGLTIVIFRMPAWYSTYPYSFCFF